jgi:hypothetical protein
MDTSTSTALAHEELNEATLIGAVVYGAGNVKIGTVSHVHGLNAVLQVFIEAGGGQGISAKPVALATSELNFRRADDGAVYGITTWNEEQVNALPEHHH